MVLPFNCSACCNVRISSSFRGTIGKRRPPTGIPFRFNAAFTGAGLGAAKSAFIIGRRLR